jgi:hypothetical protein
MTEAARWAKSSRSSGASENCVELAWTRDRLRDSKNPAGPTLSVDLTGFLDDVKGGRFDRRSQGRVPEAGMGLCNLS